MALQPIACQDAPNSKETHACRFEFNLARYR